MKIIVLVLVFLFTLHADSPYLRTIRVGSYPNEKTAQEALKKLQDFIKTQPNILDLQKKWDFQFRYRPSGKYYITLVTPLKDRKVLQEVLDTLRKAYPDIYVTRIKPEDIALIKDSSKQKNQSQQKELSDPSQNQNTMVEKKTQPTLKEFDKVEEKLKKETLQNEITQPSIQQTDTKPKNPQKTTISDIKPIQTIIPKEEPKQKPQQHQIQNLPSNNTTNVMFYVAIFIISIIFFILIYLIYRSKKKITSLENKLFINEEKLQQAKNQIKQKEQWVSYVSHELRDPISSIMGLLNLFKETPLTDQQKEYLHNIEKSSTHVLALLNDILDLSKIRSGNLTIQQKEFNIDEVIRYTYNTVSKQAKANNISLIVKINKDVPSKIISDPFRLKQILINLLSNAVKFSKDADVLLKVEKKEQFGNNITLKFTISDNGIGISQEELQNLFNPYFKSEKSDETNINGTGLGLYISKNLIEMLGGNIKVQSKENIGTTFEFEITAKIKDAQNKRQYRLPSKKLLNKRVLIIDESNITSLALKESFEYFRYHVEHIPSFEKTRKNLQGQQFDIIVIKLQNLSQLSIKRLKEFKIKDQTKIVLLDDLQTKISHKPLKNLVIDASLKPPITLQGVMDLIIELFLPKKATTTQTHPLKEKLKKFSGKKILIVEDNELNQKIISSLFRNTNIELSFAENGEKALDMLQKGIHVDLILMDLNMPVMDGYQTALEIRKNPAYNHIPIIAVSASVSEKTIDKVLKSGMQDHIAKPIDIDKFYTTLIHFFETKEFEIVTSHNHLHVSSNDDDFSFEIGLQHCNNDKKMFKDILKDFIKMYSFSAYDLHKMCEKEQYNKARHLTMDLKDVAFNIGAYKLGEITANLQYAIEREDQKSWKLYLENFDKTLKKFIEDAQKYLQEN
ncbi:MAG: response regulator [Epsilonproteobacteria bacterium]|nr:response regulator [Campylobacterota bacterium]